MASLRLCSVSGCGKKHFAKGMCRNHYRQMRYMTDLDYRQRSKDQQRESVKRNREKYTERERAWRQNNAERSREHSKRWREKNQNRARLLHCVKARRYREKMSSDPGFLLRKRMSARMLRSLKCCGGSKERGWEALVGYTLADLRAHLERLFLPGMTWSNMGEWHVDHVRPVSSFDISSPDCASFRACWALTNLQPLWAVDNLKKYNKRLPPSDPASEE